MPKNEYQTPEIEIKELFEDIITKSKTETEGRDWGLGPVMP